MFWTLQSGSSIINVSTVCLVNEALTNTGQLVEVKAEAAAALAVVAAWGVDAHRETTHVAVRALIVI